MIDSFLRLYPNFLLLLFCFTVFVVGWFALTAPHSTHAVTALTAPPITSGNSLLTSEPKYKRNLNLSASPSHKLGEISTQQVSNSASFTVQHPYISFGIPIFRLFFGHFEKTQAQKNSKLKENLEKTQAKPQKNSKTGNSS